MLRPYDLVIFDCDGTLVDSEALNNSVTAQMIAEAGLPQYDVQYCLDHFAGITLTNMIQILEERHPDIRFPANAVAQCRVRVKERMPAELNAIPGAPGAVQAVQNMGYKTCVASNGERGSVLQSLELTGLSGLLPPDITFTADMVKNPKPAPDLFLFAAEKAGVRPERCLVIEDSVFGVRAARAAGMDVVGMVGVHHEPEKQATLLRGNGAMTIITALSGISALLDPAAQGLVRGQAGALQNG